MTRWHTIVVTDGGRRLHTFDYVPRIGDQDKNIEPPRLAWHHKAIVDSPANHRIHPTAIANWRPGMSPAEFAQASAARAGYRRYLPQTFNHVPLEDISARLDIADGFNPPGQMLAVILDALRMRDTTSPRPRRSSSVELADLEAAVTRHGQSIRKLISLPPEQRRLAEPALQKLIAEHCAID